MIFRSERRLGLLLHRKLCSARAVHPVHDEALGALSEVMELLGIGMRRLTVKSLRTIHFQRLVSPGSVVEVDLSISWWNFLIIFQ